MVGIHSEEDVYGQGYWEEDVLDALCKVFRQANPMFNEPRWRRYVEGECGPSGGKIT